MDTLLILKSIFALTFVIAIIWLITYLLRRFGPEKLVYAVNKFKKTNQQRRIEILEVLPIDTRRKLLLIKRDDTEHLILLGQESDVVVERGIRKIKKGNSRAEKVANKTSRKSANASRKAMASKPN